MVRSLEALRVLHELCDLVIKGFLAPRKNHRWLPKEGFEALTEYVGRAEAVAVSCNETGLRAFVRRLIKAREICNDIASIRSNVLGFVMVNTLVLADGSHVSKPYSRLGNPACALLAPASHKNVGIMGLLHQVASRCRSPAILSFEVAAGNTASITAVVGLPLHKPPFAFL